jgi:uroporphyrinogen-III synthase
MNTKPLTGRTIAIPETRELDLFARMLQSRGAATVHCPLVAILDAPDPAPILSWLNRFIAGEMDDLILLTGEGLRRLVSRAERSGMREAFIARLGSIRKITRGPKPDRALRDIGLRTDLAAGEPTTDGVIATLRQVELFEHRVGVQLYGNHPNTPLMAFLQSAGAVPDPVAPYIYASKAEDDRVLGLIRRLASGEIDVIAFTSAQQFARLCDVAKENRLEEALRQGLARTKVAAVGPIVAETLRQKNIRVDMMPEESFFMKPLVNEIVAAIGTTGG